MNKEDYFLIRRKKRLTLTKLAKFMNCSQSLLSRYELNDCNMSQSNIKKYKKYIEEY